MSSLKRKFARARKQRMRAPSYFLTKAAHFNQQKELKRVLVQRQLQRQMQEKEAPPQRKGR